MHLRGLIVGDIKISKNISGLSNDIYFAMYLCVYNKSYGELIIDQLVGLLVVELAPHPRV
jgi:hypothetical protein